MVRALFALGLLLVGAAHAGAQDTASRASPEARRHFEAGTAAFDVGDYEQAATEFRAAYDLTRHPDLLFNVYSALERAGRIEEAAEALDGYLRDGDPDGERRAALTARLARLRERIAGARAAREEPAPIAEPTQAAPAPAPAAPAADGGVHPAPIALLVAGGALLVTFAILAGVAAAEDARLSDACSPGCSADDVGTLGALTLGADVAWISGAVAAAAGLVLLFVLPPEGESAQAALVPFVTPTAAGVSAVGRF
ncbi:MAG: tetratricopeptide repeat protein [Sandaracinaceae bacterium]|nr:tetratricopeptide repeat protein [Sandaracinaceae bacterium]